MPTVNDVIIRRMREQDIEQAAEVHAAAFPRQTFSKEWIQCGFGAFPKIQFFVAEHDAQIVGVIFWTEKSGFRKEAIVELEQIAVRPSLHGQGIGTALIQQSLPSVAAKIAERGASVKHLLVNTRADNYAQQLYRKAMGAVPAATISGMFPVDEVYMIAKDVDIDPSAKSYTPAGISLA